MTADETPDYYEILQISPNADQETIQRVFRLLARRFHPDNTDTGDRGNFLLIQKAYDTLSHAEKRAQYDVAHGRLQKERWRIVETGAQGENNFQLETQTRLTVLEVLYTDRRLNPESPGVLSLDLEQLTGCPREHLTFTLWYLMRRKLVSREDNSRLGITAEGVDYLEENYEANLQRRRLEAGRASSTSARE
jgi:curved DNA-binding protein CbpA